MPWPESLLDRFRGGRWDSSALFREGHGCGADEVSVTESVGDGSESIDFCSRMTDRVSGCISFTCRLDSSRRSAAIFFLTSRNAMLTLANASFSVIFTYHSPDGCWFMNFPGSLGLLPSLVPWISWTIRAMILLFSLRLSAPLYSSIVSSRRSLIATFPGLDWMTCPFPPQTSVLLGHSMIDPLRTALSNAFGSRCCMSSNVIRTLTHLLCVLSFIFPSYMNGSRS
mmetsp:Transcript_37199/g.90244  ORF Transcript_37199/g.90244 Transcript_37199/m.90244 type:complete len:226 (-) Transcript_37199:1030-1707(-)